MTLADDINALQARLASAQREHSRAEGARDNAEAAAEHARAELQQRFDVSTVEEAEQLLEKIRAQVADIVTELTQLLDGIETK